MLKWVEIFRSGQGRAGPPPAPYGQPDHKKHCIMTSLKPLKNIIMIELIELQLSENEISRDEDVLMKMETTEPILTSAT